MLKKIIIFLILLVNSQNVLAAHLNPEKYYQDIWCAQRCGKTEVILNDKTRVDCVTKEYAIEFDFAQKWAEAVGQSLYYAEKTGLKPGIVLIMEKDTDYKYYKRVKLLADKYNIQLWCMRPSAQN